MQKSILSVSGIAILGLLLLLVNAISDASFSRFFIDLTDEGLYSLSKGSRNTLQSLQSPITLRFYFSKTDGGNIPAVKLYGQRVSDLLREYERQSDGKITLEVYDPRPDTDEEDWAQKYGLTPLALPSGERLFFGLAAVNAYGDEAAIPLFNMRRQEFLEYDVTKLIHTLATSEKPKIAVISSLELGGGKPAMPQPGMPPAPRQEPWILISQLQTIADVEVLGSDVSAIKPETDVLMVIFPQNLPEQTRYAIDQYAVKGGKVFVAVDPFCSVYEPDVDSQNPFAAMGADRSADLDLLSTWGVSLKEKQVLADINLATQVGSPRGGPPQQFPLWLTVSSMYQAAGSDSWVVNPDEITTSELENLMFPWPGALKIEEKEGLSITPLIRTTPEAMLYSDADVRFSGDDPEAILKKYQRGNQSEILAVKVSGKLKSAFSNKPGAEDEETQMSSSDGHVAEGLEPAHIVVVADVDFLADRYAAQAQNLFGARLITLLNDNLLFAVNTAENLTGSDDLISLRSRGQFSRPFTKVQEIEAAAHERWKQEEMVLQAKLNEANQRLAQLQSGTDTAGGKTAFSSALLEEINRFREERKNARESLREVRRKLREDKEHLGSLLFALNTFLVPVVLVGVSVVGYRRRTRRVKDSHSHQ